MLELCWILSLAQAKTRVPQDHFAHELQINSLPAMDAHERPLFIELRGTVVSH